MKLSGLFSVLAFAMFSALAAAADEVVINFDQANAPFMYAKEGKAAGVYPALIDAAFKKMKVGVQLKAVPWERAKQAADDASGGIGGVYKNAEREKKYDFSDQLFVEKLVVYVNKSKSFNFTKVDDLKGKQVGVLRGWSYGDDFDNARKAGSIKVAEVAADTQNFEKLDQGRVDAVIAIAETGDAMLGKYKNIAATATPLAQNPTYLAFGKAAKQEALLKQFNQVVKDMKTSGEFKKIVAAELAK